MKDTGVVCDLGCGPGHVSRYLWERGVEVCGIDLSSELVERACGLNPGINFRQGNLFKPMLRMRPVQGLSCSTRSSMYLLPTLLAFSEMKRALRPGGLVLVAFHVGEQVLHFDELWGQKVFIDFHLFPSSKVVDALRSAGFEIEKIIERDPYPEVEAQTRRAYILARVASPKTA